jgi:hypothetical protein
MRSISTAALPQVVLQHIDAYRSHDPEAFMSTLAPEPLVNDIQREFLGHPAIRSWAEKEIFGDNVTLEIEAAFEHFGNTIVRFNVDGDFDKANLPDPFDLDLLFLSSRPTHHPDHHPPQQGHRRLGRRLGRRLQLSNQQRTRRSWVTS